MDLPEDDRIRELDMRLAGLRRKRAELHLAWNRVQREKRDLEEQLETLSDERQGLAQGQLILRQG